jgi:pimeloyl-ACP methyl ester carboxylesterase
LVNGPHGAQGTLVSHLGWTGKPDGHRVTLPACVENAIVFDNARATRVAFDTADTKFTGANVSLAGRLVMPKGNARLPIAVLVHGSEHYSGRDFYWLQWLLPASGIGVFVYDKRGTGDSGGAYTQSFLLLAEDAHAAMREAKRLAGPRAGRIGYEGGSQGGWVAPLAALFEPVDYVVVGFGLAVSPLDEDRSEVALDLTRRGFGPADVAKAMEIADASAEILTSNFTRGFDRMRAARAKYQHDPWFKYVHGDVTFALMDWPEAKLRDVGPKEFGATPMTYDALPVLRALTVPELWILAANDTEAPSAETIRRLHALAAAGKPISTAVFPHTDHGIYDYVEDKEGNRTTTRNPDGYYSLIRDFIRDGHIAGRYGNAALSLAAPDR